MRFKNILFTGIAAAVMNIPFMTVAQTVSETETPHQNVVERLEQESEGRIQIEIPKNILDLILNANTGVQKKVEKRKVSTLQKGINKIRGYRVQVFSDGRNQSTLEARVKTRANAISARFPKYRGQVYTFSSSPNWYCRVGNFQTKEEASAALLELKRAFPGFAGEMRVVNSEVVIIK